MPRGGAEPPLAVELVVDDGDRQVRLLAHGLAARGDRVQPRREWPQGLNEPTGVPARRVPAQQVGELQILEHAAELLAVRGVQHRGERRHARALRMLNEEGPREAGQLPSRRQPFAERLRLTIGCNRFCAVETRCREHLIDDQRGILVPHPERIARLVRQTRAFERQLDVTHVLGRVAPGDALIGEHRRGIRLLAGVLGRGRHGTQSRDGGDGRRAERLARLAHDLFEPRRREPLVVEIAIDPFQQAPGAERRQAFVDQPAGLAEFRIARVAKREHRVLELLELRCALAGEVVDEAARVVGRVAVAVRAHHDDEKPFLREILERVVARRLHPHREPRGLGRTPEAFRDALAISGLRTIDHGQPGLGFRARRTAIGSGTAPDRPPCARSKAMPAAKPDSHCNEGASRPSTTRATSSDRSGSSGPRDWAKTGWELMARLESRASTRC